MLQGWLPARWAFLGGLLAAFHPKILARWGLTYWGGAVAMLGGALVYGSLPRIMRRPCLRHTLLMGFGLAILANSRPFEGLVASLPAAAVLLTWMVGKNGPTRRVAVGRIVVPILSVVMVTAGWIGYYNFRVSGNPLRLPHQVYSATYSDPVGGHRHREFREGGVSTQLSLVQKLERQRKFYLPTVLTVPLLDATLDAATPRNPPCPCHLRDSGRGERFRFRIDGVAALHSSDDRSGVPAGGAGYAGPLPLAVVGEAASSPSLLDASRGLCLLTWSLSSAL